MAKRDKRDRLKVQAAAALMSPAARERWFLRYIEAPDHAAAAVGEFAAAAVGDQQDTHDLVELAAKIHYMLEPEQRADYCHILCEATLSGPRVRGAVLAATWTSGRQGSPLRVAGYTRQQILDWFCEASPETLMTAPDREALATMADVVPIWRGAPAEPLARARAALSWTLDRQQAEWFAASHAGRTGGPAMLIQADVPRAAIVAYMHHGRRAENEIVVDWRRLRRVRLAPGA